MLDFVSAEESSMDEFLSVSAASPFQAELEKYAESLLEQGFTKPEWCLLGLHGGAPIARAALWALPDRVVPTDTVLIAAPWDDERLSAGHELLAKVHELAGRIGADSLNHSVDSPPAAPQYQENEEARVRLLEGSGYEQLRDGLRWRYSATARTEATPASLAFRTLAEVGEDTFVEAIAATYAGTRDAWIAQNIDENGALEAARADFLEQQGLEYRSEWWELAYTTDGSLAGVIMAARNPSVAVVSYVGVVPEQRGRGLAPELVRRGTERLLDGGADDIRGDCDRDNVAMVKAFVRAGYEEFARRRTYRHVISSS